MGGKASRYLDEFNKVYGEYNNWIVNADPAEIPKHTGVISGHDVIWDGQTTLWTPDTHDWYGVEETLLGRIVRRGDEWGEDGYREFYDAIMEKMLKSMHGVGGKRGRIANALRRWRR